jgi:hypothetical protein
MVDSVLISLEEIGTDSKEQAIVNTIGSNFDKLAFDTKISLLNALRDHISISCN